MHTTSKNNIKFDPRITKRLEHGLVIIQDWAKDSLLEVALFGSYARNREHEYSSIDLLIILKNSDKRFIDRKIELERLLNQADDMPMIDTLVYTEEEILELIDKMESFIVSVIGESILLWNGFNEIDLDNLNSQTIISSRYKASLPKLGMIYD